MQGFFDSIRIELAGQGVDVLVISPGFVATEIRSLGYAADGTPHGQSPRDEAQQTMSVEQCVRIMLRAIERREREVVMTGRAKLGMWLRLVAPGVVDKIAARAVRTRDAD